MAKAKPKADESRVSLDELDLEILEDEDRMLRVPVNYYRVDENSESVEFLDKAWIRYPIRRQLPIPTMTSLLRLEARINEALQADSDVETDGALQEALTDSYRRIISIVVERTPRAFELVEIRGVKAKPEIELDTTQVLATLAWISGDASVADAVARTVTAGKSHALSREELLESAEDAFEGDPGSDEATPVGPFPSSTS